MSHMFELCDNSKWMCGDHCPVYSCGCCRDTYVHPDLPIPEWDHTMTVLPVFAFSHLGLKKKNPSVCPWAPGWPQAAASLHGRRTDALSFLKKQWSALRMCLAVLQRTATLLAPSTTCIWLCAAVLPGGVSAQTHGSCLLTPRPHPEAPIHHACCRGLLRAELWQSRAVFPLTSSSFFSFSSACTWSF